MCFFFKGFSIIFVKNDHGENFENKNFWNLIEKYGINHNFSTRKILKQNGIVRKRTVFYKNNQNHKIEYTIIKLNLHNIYD